MDASIITIWGRSGAGKTTLAVNLACALAQTRCVGLVSSNLQYGHLQVFYGQTIRPDKGLLNALEDPAGTKKFFWKSGKSSELMENLFLLTVPNDYTGLLCDNVSQESVEQVLERARPFFEVLVIDGSEDLMNPVSSVGITQSSHTVIIHNPSVASGLWYRSMGDFIYQLHLEDKLSHVTQESPWGLAPQEYAAALGLDADVQLPYVQNARQLEDNGSPIFLENDKACKRYKKQLTRLLEILHDKEAFA